MVDQEAAGGWNYTSTVVTDPKKATCPAPKQGNECKSCRACWDKKVKNVAYLAHQFRMILMYHSPKYWKEMAKKRKEFEREQANKRASEQANERASEQANGDQASEEDSSNKR